MTRLRALWGGLVIAALGRGGPAAAQEATADSALVAACAAGGGVAEGLLVVEFRADLSAEQRGVIARDAGGRHLGAGSGGEGDYILMPAQGRAALDAAADRLILVKGVQAVGGAMCPPAAPPAATPGDTGRPESAARAPSGASPDTTRASAAPGDSASAP